MATNLLTAEQMAKDLGLSVKTFYKRVRKYKIPFLDARQPLFEPAEVYRRLKTTFEETGSAEKPNPARRGLILPNRKYREILGLEK